MGFSVSGIASGIQTDQIITQLMSVEQRPILLMQQRQQQMNSRLSALQELNHKVAALRSSAELVQDGFQDRSVTVSDTSALQVSASTTVALGDHQVEVLQTAVAQRRVSQGVSSTGSSIVEGGGEFSFRVGSGELTTLHLEAGSTLADLVRQINQADAGLQASIINDGSLQEANRLVLSSKESGSAGEVTLVTNDTILDFEQKRVGSAEALTGNSGSYTGTVASSGSYTGTGNKNYLIEVVQGGAVGAATYRYSLDDGLTWNDNGGAGYTVEAGAFRIGGNNEGVEITFEDDASLLSARDRFRVDVFDPQLQASRDAILSIDGLRIVSSSNTVDQAIEGVTFTLGQVSEGPVEVSIRQDTTSIYEKVNGFLVTYNALASFVNAQSAYNEQTQTAGALSGDSALRTIVSRFRGILGAPAPGLSGSLNSLASLGIKASKNGIFELDRSTFDQVLQSNPEAVSRILLGGGDSTSSQLRFVSKTDEVPSGSFNLMISGVGEDRQVSLGGEVLEVDGTTLRGRDGGQFAGLVLEVPELETVSEGLLGTLTLSSGIAQQVAKLGNEMVDSTTGLIQGKTRSAQRSIEDLNDRIQQQQDRLGLVEQRMRSQFTALEVTLGRLTTQSSFLAQQIAQWS